MRYVKLEDQTLLFAPNPILLGQTYIGNPPGSVYEAQGFKPLQMSPCPELPPQTGFRWEPQWVESAEAITQSWVQRPLPPDEELSGEEALDILLGGDGG